MQQEQIQDIIDRINGLKIKALEGHPLVPDSSGIFISIKNVDTEQAQKLKTRIQSALSARGLLQPGGKKQINVTSDGGLMRGLDTNTTTINILVSAINMQQLTNPKELITKNAAGISAGVGAIKGYTPDDAATVAAIAKLLGVTDVSEVPSQLGSMLKQIDKDPRQKEELQLLTRALNPGAKTHS